MNRTSTGLPDLDKLVEGGLPEHTVTLLSGGPGTGKTLFGLNFVTAGGIAGEKCCYLTLNERPEELLKACRLKSLSPIHKHLGKNLVIEELEMGGEIDVDYFEKLFKQYPDMDRLVIDNLNKLLIHAEDRRQYRIALSNTVKFLRSKIRSTILVCETEKDRIDTGNGEAFECDGVIHLSFLELEEKPKRTLEIPKMRYTAFDPKIQHEYRITPQEIKFTETKII